MSEFITEIIKITAGMFLQRSCVYPGYIVHWEIRQSMQESDSEIVLQRAREAFPTARPRVISDRGSQFVSRDFKDFVRQIQCSHVTTSPNYPQSNGKIERFHKTLKHDCIRKKTPLTLEDAKRISTKFIDHYNSQRLHSAIKYIAPADRLAGNHQKILDSRFLKLENARKLRKLNHIQKQKNEDIQKLNTKSTNTTSQNNSKIFNNKNKLKSQTPNLILCHSR